VKVLLEINKETWAKVKEYATLQEVKLGKAVEQLLRETIGEKTDYHDNNRG
jgi:hypothetical protein